MRKYLICLSLVVITGNIKVSAQPLEAVPGTSTNATRAFKVYNNPTTDKTDNFDITGFGGTTFTASNTADGTTNSFNHNVQIVVALTSSKAGNNFQLNFYNSPSNIQQAATYTDGTLNIYYPVQLYDAIRTRLEQAFAAKRKVSVKVVQKTNGYREGTLVL